MDVKEAITKAKSYVADMFADEKIANIGLEEVRIDDDDEAWLITIGFSRVMKLPTEVFPGFGPSPYLPRVYKVVKIDGRSGDFVSITNRNVEA